MVSKALVSRMAPFVWKYIEELQHESEFLGTCAGVFKIMSEASGSGTNGAYDRFHIAFPYGAQCCKWELIFNSNLPDDPPDFIFLNNDQDFLPEFDDLRSLHSWDPEDSSSLCKVMSELVEKYKTHHKKLIEGTRVDFELLSLTRCEEFGSPEPKITTNAIIKSGDDGKIYGGSGNKGGSHDLCHHFNDSEVYVVRKNNGALGPIQIAVKLPIDFSCLSEIYNQDDSGGGDKVLAIVVYENLDGGSVTTQICPSVRVEKAVRAMGRLPQVAFPLEGCLHDYIISVTSQIADMIDRLQKSFEKRKQFIQCLTAKFASYLIEYDATSYNHIYLLVSTESSSTLLLTIDIPSNFPTIQPTLVLSSTIKESSTKAVKDYPYSPRWPAEEMAERLRNYVREHLPAISKEIDVNNNSNNNTKSKATTTATTKN